MLRVNYKIGIEDNFSGRKLLLTYLHFNKNPHKPQNVTILTAISPFDGRASSPCWESVLRGQCDGLRWPQTQF